MLIFSIFFCCFKISSEGAGLGTVSNIKSLLQSSFESIVSSSSRLKLLLITYDVLFQGPKVANCTRHRNIYIRWAIDICTYGIVSGG